MKRVISVLLALVLVVGGSCIVRADDIIGDIVASMTAELPQVSEDTEGSVIIQDEPADAVLITFRNIPWGTTYADVVNYYNDFGLQYDPDPYLSSYLAVPKSENSKIDVYSNGFSVADTDVAGFERSASDYSDGVGSVAGYNIYSAEYSFIMPVDETTGYVDSNIDNAKLYSALYSFFEMNDATAMVEDLVGKLSSIYGEPSQTDHDNYSSGDARAYTMWEDEEGNWIILQHNIEVDDPDRVYLKYYCGQIFDWMDSLSEAYYKAEADNFVAPEGTDGL